MSGNREIDKLLAKEKPGYNSLQRKPSHGTADSMALSSSELATLSEEVSRQKTEYRKRADSLNDSDYMRTTSPVTSHLFLDANDDVEKQGRRTLYGTLPFVAAFGMQKKETAMKKVVSAVSLNLLMAASSESLEAQKNTNNDLAQVDVDEITITFHLVVIVAMAAVSQFLVGYNTSVMNAPESVVFPDHTTTQWSLAVSAFAIGGPGGAVLGGLLANKRGRRGAMQINIWIFLLGGLLMTFSRDVYWLIPARLIIGFASGVSSVVVPVYLGEIAPPTLRGTLGTLTQFSMVIGILVSVLLAFPLATTSSWRYLFSVTPLLALVLLCASYFLLESPRWLLNRDEHSKEARLVIKKLRGFRKDREVEQEVQNFLFASVKHKTPYSSAHSSAAMCNLLGNKDMRVLVVSAIVLQMAQQLCGINAVFYYSTLFFNGVISNPLMGTALVATVNVIATYVALKLMDSTNRRTLLLWSSGGMIISTVLIICALLFTWLPKYIALIAVMTFVTFFEIGLGPIPWLIVAEMFDSKYVATAMSLACIVNWGCNFLVGFIFPFMNEYLGPWSFAPFCVVLVISFLFTFFYLPETHGKSIEEVNRLIRDYNRRGGSGGAGSDRDDEQFIMDAPVIYAVEMIAPE